MSLAKGSGEIIIAVTDAASAGLVTTQQLQEEDRFDDSFAEYQNFAKTGEKLPNGLRVGDEFAIASKQFDAVAAPQETIRLSIGGYGNGVGTAATVEAVREAAPSRAVDVLIKEYDQHHILSNWNPAAGIIAADQNSSVNFSNSFWGQSFSWKVQPPKKDATVTDRHDLHLDFSEANRAEQLAQIEQVIAEAREEKIAKPVIEINVTLTGNSTEDYLAQLGRVQEFVQTAWATNEKGLPLAQAVLNISHESRSAELTPAPRLGNVESVVAAEMVNAFRLAGKPEIKAKAIAAGAKALDPRAGRLVIIEPAKDSVAEKVILETVGHSNIQPYSVTVDAAQEELAEKAGEYEFAEGAPVEFGWGDLQTPDEKWRAAVYFNQATKNQSQAALKAGAYDKQAEIEAQAGAGEAIFRNKVLIVTPKAPEVSLH